MTLVSIREGIHGKLLRLRALDRLVQSTHFEAALRLKPDCPHLPAALENPDLLQKWIDSTLTVELESLSVRELRMRASRLGIAFYSSLTKTALILKIIEVQNARKTKDASVGVSHPSEGRSADSGDESRRTVLCGTSA